MKVANAILFLVLLFSLAACGENAQSNENGEVLTVDTAASKVVIEVDEKDQQVTIPTGIVFDTERFPYLEPLNDSTTLMQAYSVKMQLTHSYPLAPVTNDRLMWIDENNSNETMGTFLSYVIQGRKIMLAGVNARVDYFNKKVKGYSSIDSSFYSSRSYFLLDAEKSRVLKERQEIKTASGKPAYVEEYYSVRGEHFTPKYVVLGYLDYNEDYMVSFVMNATDEFEFQDALDSFYQLVSSFRID